MPDCGREFMSTALLRKPVSIRWVKGDRQIILWQTTTPGKLGFTSRAKGTGLTIRHVVGP